MINIPREQLVQHARNQPNTSSLEDGQTSAVEHRARSKWTVEMNFALIEARTVRFPHFLPEKDMQDILAPEDHKQGIISKDRPARHHHGNTAKKMEVAWACYQQRPR